MSALFDWWRFVQLPQVLVLLVLLFVPAPAAAKAPSRLAVLPLQVDAPTDEDPSVQLREALRGALAGQQELQVLAEEEVDRLYLITEINCTSTSCLKRAARTMKVDLLVGGRAGLTRQQGADVWTLAIWIFDARQEATVATEQGGCERCTMPQATKMARTMAVKLLQQARRNLRSAKLDIRSLPPGAQVRIDGAPVGVTNMTFGVTPGRHTIALQRDGFLLYVQEVSATSEQADILEAQLVPVSEKNNLPDGHRRTSLGWLKWTLSGVALVALTTGIVLWSRGKETDSVDEQQGANKQLRDYTPPGIALTTLGGIAALGAGFTFWLDARPAEGQPPTRGETGPLLTVILSAGGQF